MVRARHGAFRRGVAGAAEHHARRGAGGADAGHLQPALGQGGYGGGGAANADGATRTSALLVPLSAVVQAKDGKYGVFVVSSSGAGEVAHLHSVDIGTVNGSEITVVSGLQRDRKST